MHEESAIKAARQAGASDYLGHVPDSSLEQERKWIEERESGLKFGVICALAVVAALYLAHFLSA